MYFHSETTLPIRTTEKDQDSEDETIPEWMRVKTIQVNFIDKMELKQIHPKKQLFSVASRLLTFYTQHEGLLLNLLEIQRTRILAEQSPLCCVGIPNQCTSLSRYLFPLSWFVRSRFPSLNSLSEVSALNGVRTPALLSSRPFSPTRFYFVRNRTLDGLKKNG